MEKTIKIVGESIQISDGYHTFDELYEHRIALYISLCSRLSKDEYWNEKEYRKVWRSKLHSDGSSFDGWFILGIYTSPGNQITYHLPMDRWEVTEFAETLDKAPEWDGHTSDDVLERLASLVK